jgi:DNA (cytosine-5)-methyltransferase 3A
MIIKRFNSNLRPPKDKKIFLKDIIESGVVDRDKSYCIDANYFKGGSVDTLMHNYFDKSRRQIVGVSYAPQSVRRLMVSEPIQIDSLFENNAQAGRVYSKEGKAVTLKANGGGMGAKTGLYETDDITYRMLTPLECERLQTFPDGYTEGISNTQRYKSLGNSWTVDMIVHILSYLHRV